ncbi:MULTISPECIES: carbohydrate ABC transporter permease [unclassified Paenibacillus]|uniref:carbohydrate ABC transporter permease n=1 Tax=unclassified Paenibacillus TaxID=185978 RepID=UPI001C124D1B|nr:MULTISPECIES: sugar ABC transporter permease [unclassified Paenibacillus]MBU5443683.1 sugar ABC transporter permease [Paenibacillus sp. MSJ-34]CAH0117656.1 Trehalose transport system permease protein SugA [Paenibacillus sp. CECT 9249]
MKRERKSAAVGYLFVAPALIVLAVVGFYPLLRTLILSLYDASFINPVSEFVGFGNYMRLGSDIWFKKAYGNTWLFTFVSVMGEALIGLGIALLLDQKLPGRKWVRVSILIPWAIPTVISASMWQWLYNADFGLINYLLTQIGIVDSYQNWLGESSSALWAAIAADVWKTTPFMALILLAGLQTVPEEIYEAADMDGIRSWQRFWHITLPLLMPILLTALLLRALDAFRVFDLIYVLTGGGPANSTEVLSSYAYKITFSSTQVGYGASMAAVMAASVLVFAILMQLLLKRTYARIEGDS